MKLPDPGPVPPQAVPPPPEDAEDTIAELRAQLQVERLKLKGIEEISRALGSEHNLDRILETVMDRTTELLDAERSTLFVLDDQSAILWSRATQGGEVATLEIKRGQGIAGWVVDHGRTVNVKDAYKDPRFESTLDERTGYRTTSVLCAPLRDSQQKIIGAIQVLNKRRGYFTPADEDLLAAIASQAAISIQNSSLYLDIVGKNIDLLETSMRLESRTAELELLFRIERAAAMAITLEGALDAVLNETAREFPCEAMGAFLVDPDHDALSLRAGLGEQSGRLANGGASFGEALAARVLATGETFRIPARTTADGSLEGLIGAAGDWPIHHLVALPIVHKDNRLGALMLLNRGEGHRGFDDQDTQVLHMIASRIGLAMTLSHALDEEQKAERLAAIGQMLSGVLHDLKTPLTIISGYARLMARTDDSDKREEQRGFIKRQIEQLKDMTGELLAFARGESEMLLRKVFVRDFLEEIRLLLTEEFAGSGIELVIEARYAGAVRMDENKMRRIIYNLARNAREAMDSGGQFSITVAEEDDRVIFCFVDQGPGIPEEIQGRLFDPFATFGKQNGTGLGLAIVKKIVDQHGGEIRVSSAPGAGTTFTIAIPK